MRATRTLGRGITIENTDKHAYRVERVIANNSPENANCNNYPATSLAPGESHSIFFLLCGSISSLDVVTDEGTASLRFDTEGAQ